MVGTISNCTNEIAKTSRFWREYFFFFTMSGKGPWPVVSLATHSLAGAEDQRNGVLF